MKSQPEAEVKEMQTEPAGNERSTIEFPYTDLDNAIEIVRGVHEVGGTACTFEQLAAHLGVEAKGGSYRLRVNGAKTYDLINYERGGRITLTDLGRRLLDPQQERGARAEAFLKVPLFQRAFEEFKGSPLPPQAGLERAITGFGVGAKVSDRARQVMLRSARQAGYFELSQDRLTSPPIRPGEPPPKREEIKERTGGGNGGGGDGGHPLIKGLLLTLPAPNGPWSTRERMNWLVMANSIFKNIYQSQDQDDVVIQLQTAKKGASEVDDPLK